MYKMQLKLYTNSEAPQRPSNGRFELFKYAIYILYNCNNLTRFLAQLKVLLAKMGVFATDITSGLSSHPFQ